MSNPFNKLKVQRDEEEDFTVVQSKAAAQKKVVDDTKKPKQRPKEEKTEDDNEGFEVVGKVSKKQPRYQGEQTEEEKKPKAREEVKHHHKHDGVVRVSGNQRPFDRHSGTGRGKEVSKQGAGGKGTWGNQEKSAKREIQDYDDTDHYFNKVLKPKKEEALVEEPAVEEPKAEEVKVEEEAKDEKKGKKKIVVDPVEDEKNKLHIPENAISLAEWKEQNKRTAPVHKQVKVEVNLEPIKKGNEEFLGVAGKKKNDDKKKKTKEVDQKEVEINKLLNVKIDDGTQKRTFNQNKGYGQKGFKFTDNEFPELK
jgi:hypothetical protein